MKAVVILLFLAYALVDGFPGRSRYARKLREAGKTLGSTIKPLYFEDLKVKLHEGVDTTVKDMDKMTVRWCVTNFCEKKKCDRMTTEFNYAVTPRMHWSCVMKTSKVACMKAIQHGLADIMTAEGEEIYTGGKTYDMKPIMVAKYDDSEQHEALNKHYSVVLVKKLKKGIDSFGDMRQTKSCHPGIDTMAAFKAPMCSLINQGIVPKVGNVYESAGEFFQESCVPGVQHIKYNPNMTNPESLCKLCKGKTDDIDFCMTMSSKEPHYGYSGALKCLSEGHGDVGFFHTYDIMKHYRDIAEEYEIVCKTERAPLTWDNIIKKDCHLTVEHPQVVMVYKNKPKSWIQKCTFALEDAATLFSSESHENTFSLFDSTPYCPITNDETDNKEDEELDKDESRWKHTDLIFKHHYTSLEKLSEDQTYKDFLTTDMVNIWKTCEQLQPKPRAFICVVGDEEMKKCRDMVSEFDKIPDVRRNVSWGCVKAMSKKGCVEMVTNNAADIVLLNATEMFTAGMDHNLVPFMGMNVKGKDPWTESITIGIMRKDSSVPPQDMRDMKMCNAGVHKISGFLHPMGWLLANGTIERSTSFLESIRSHFGDSCVPGMNTVDLKKHPLLSQTLDWKTLLHDTKWEDYYKTPMWRKWEDKKDGAASDYEPVHKIFGLQFQKLMMMLKSEDPLFHHIPKIREIMEKLKKDFSWTNYVGLDDFYGLVVPKWKLISWAWQKPQDWTDMEWHLFMRWAEYLWDQELDWKLYTDMWTDEDWKTFKEWIDTEYEDYVKDITPGLIHKDFFIRMTLLCSRYHWLTKQWKRLQWDNIHTKNCRDKMCNACAGQGDMKCSMDTASEDYYDYIGAMKCLKDKSGDVAFVDWYAFEDAMGKYGFHHDDFSLLCPDGKKINETGREAVEECNFGHVPSIALVTCNMHDGVWRWKVTKAFLEAQKVLSTQMFEDDFFGEKTESMSPMPLVNQTYQAWLGPLLLRAMEGIMQPSVEPMVWPKELYRGTDECDNHREDFLSCDEKHTMCMEDCWRPFSPEIMKKKMGHHGKGLMIPNRPMMDMWKKKAMMVWKPKGEKAHHMLWKMHEVPMTHKRMGPQMGNKMGPMEHCMKKMMPGMTIHQKMSLVSVKYGMKPTMPDMMHMSPTGPMKSGIHKMVKTMRPLYSLMDNDKSIREEFYSKVIFARNGTCSAIVRDLSCFGDKEEIRMRAGRVSKTLISVRMCPKPAIMKNTIVQFTCDTGASFLKFILRPLQCSYVLCNPGFWLPDWTNDQYWANDHSYPGDYWGSKDWWKFDKRGDNDNWFFEYQDHKVQNRVDKQVPWDKDGLQ